MKDMSKFQIVLTAIFGICILTGVFVFAFVRPGSNVQADVVIWGSLSEGDFSAVFMNIPLSKDKTVVVQYEYKRETDFDMDFVEALASGTGPDIVLLGQDSILTHKNKLFIIPFSSYSERTFKDTYIPEGELFLDQNGVIGFPFTIDPLVMYYNRDIFTSNEIAQPPMYWTQFYELSKKLTKKDGALNISRATLPLGEFQNITNSKEIFSALTMQAGSPIVVRSQDGYVSVLGQTFEQSVTPAVSAINFYTEFSNPLKPHYSWNRSLPDSELMFTSGDLAVYFGFASELGTLKEKNPNLNFDVTQFPQAQGDTRITFGKMKALAITKSSKNPGAAFTVISGLSTVNAMNQFSAMLRLPPVRRDLISKGTTDQYLSVFYRSALWARGFPDPSRFATRDIFRQMVEAVTGGRLDSAEAVDQADQNLSALLR